MGNSKTRSAPTDRIPAILLFALFQNQLPRDLIQIIFVKYDDLLGWRFDLKLKSDQVIVDPSLKIITREVHHEMTYSGFALVSAPIISSIFRLEILPEA